MHLAGLCDRLVSKIVRHRDRYCVTCGSEKNLTCSHWIPRRFLAVRFDLRNCNTQCEECNQAHSNDAMGTPLGFPYGEYMRSHYGSEVMVELLNQKPRILKRHEIQAILDDLKKEAKRIGLT